jgi:BRCT domain type II-containing protein
MIPGKPWKGILSNRSSRRRSNGESGEEAGPKLDKGQELGVKIIDEAELVRLCDG